MSSPFGEVISVYTRAQAIEDGVLIDVTEQAKAEGFKYHTVVTPGVLAYATEQFHGATDIALLALLSVARAAVKSGPCLREDDTDRKYFNFRGQRMYLHCGPGDDAEPVLTLMLENED